MDFVFLEAEDYIVLMFYLFNNVIVPTLLRYSSTKEMAGSTYTLFSSCFYFSEKYISVSICFTENLAYNI